MNAHKNEKLNVLSMFSGCGGMDIGFEGGFRCLRRSINTELHPDWIESEDGEWVTLRKTGFRTVFANDIRPDAKAAWVSYFSQHYGCSGDIYKIESIVDLVKAHSVGEHVFPIQADVVTGGFPCQDFSVAGKRKGFDSLRNHDGTLRSEDEPSAESRGQLYMWMRDVVTITKPNVFVAENVKGLTNLKNAKEIIERDFASAADGGYVVVPAKLLNAADYGVPQSRERVIFFGFKKSALNPKAKAALCSESIPQEFDPYPKATHAYTKEAPSLCAPVTCSEAFGGLAEPEESRDPAQQRYSKAKYLGRHCQGQTEIKPHSVSPTIRAEHHGNIEFRRLGPEHGGKQQTELETGLCERRMTVRECARLQTFPDDYRFIMPKSNDGVSVSASDAYRLIGNAIPCVLAYNIAIRLEENWEKYF